MRYSEIICEAVDYDAFQAVGISPEDADKFAKYNHRPEDIASYIRMGKGVEGALQRLERERVRWMLSRVQERAQKKLFAAIPAFRNSTGPISYRAACVLIADDDDLWTFLNEWTYNASWAIHEFPEEAKRFLAILKRIKPPIHKKLFRGQQPFSERDADTHGFHSWSANRETAEMFAERTGKIIVIDRPVQGVSLEDLCTWRMRLRPGESQYGGSQAEWFVVDQPEQMER